MSAELYAFGPFRLDATNRRLERGNAVIDLNSRYLDVLILLVREQGGLVTKQRFIDHAWSGVPVTDEALTQAVRVIRRQLGDEAGRPRYIETVPKHGYRFVGAVEATASPSASVAPPPAGSGARQHWFALWRAGTLGAVAAGVLGGLIYGLAEASGPVSGSASGVSVVLVFVCLTTVIASLGGAGVSLGIVAGLRARPPRPLSIALGGAAGGLVVGALVKLVGVDAFNLLFGSAPADMTGATEGLAIGTAVGLGVALAHACPTLSVRRSALLGGLTTGIVGAVIPLMGGQMLGGSLELLALSFPEARLHFGQIGLLFGEGEFGMAAKVITGALEGVLFGGSVAGAMTLQDQRRAGHFTPFRDLGQVEKPAK